MRNLWWTETKHSFFYTQHIYFQHSTILLFIISSSVTAVVQGSHYFEQQGSEIQNCARIDFSKIPGDIFRFFFLFIQ